MRPFRSIFRKGNFLIIFLLIASSAYCYGQFDQRYTVTHYTDENGLPQNSVNGIAEDKEGFIWLTTESGLVRFDGQNFHTFDKSNSNLTTIRFNAIYPDLSGTGHKIFASNDSFEFMSIQGPNAVRDTVASVALLNRIGYKKQDLYPYLQSVVISTSSQKAFIKDLEMAFPLRYIMLAPSHAGTYYFVDHDRITFFREWKKVSAFSYKRPKLQDLFTLRDKLYCFGDNGKVRLIGPDKKESIRLTGDILNDVAYDPDKRNFIGYWNNISDQCFILLRKKLYALDPQPDGSIQTELVLNGFDFTANNIENVHFDKKKKILYLGSATHGLFVFNPKTFRTLVVSKRNLENVFYAQIPVDKNQVLTVSGDLVGLTGQAANVYDLKPEIKVLPKVKSKYLNRQGHIMKDPHGNIWVLDFQYLHKFLKGGDKLLKTWDLGDKSILYQGPYGKTWIGYERNGLGYLDMTDTDPQPRTLLAKGIKPVTYFLQISPEKLWVGTKSGLYLFNLKTNKKSVVRGTEHLFIRSIYKSPSDKGIFFTTYEDGFFYLNDGKLVNFPLDPKRYLAASHCITESKDGFFWITTNKGLFQFAKKDLLDYASAYFKNKNRNQKLFYLYYEKSSGFNTNEFNGGCEPCSVVLPDGKISLPSLNGLVWFNPATIIPDVANRKLFVDRLEVRGKSSKIVSDTIRLPMDPRQINFYLTTPYFGHRNNLRLSYFISTSKKQPADQEWLDVNYADPVIRFPELSAGQYTLLVRKVNGFGINNFETKRLMVIVTPHWYETWIFKLFCIVLLGGLIYFLVWLRTQTLNRRNEELEISIKSRTQNLEDTMIALKASESNLSRQMNMQTRLLTSISHDIRTPMKYLVEGSVKIENLITINEYVEASLLARHIGSSAQMMSNLLENIITYIKTNYYDSHIGFQIISLKTLLDEKIRLFYPAIMEQHNRFSNDVSEDIAVFSNGQLLGIVLHNLLDNANKYTYKGQIRFYTEQHPDELHLIISDTGPGYPETVLQWLENSFVTGGEEGKSLKLSPHSNGLGMIIVREIVEMLHIEMRVENQDGAKITLIFTIE